MLHAMYCTNQTNPKFKEPEADTYLVAVLTEWDSCLVVVQFTSQWNMALPALEATVMVCPV